VSGWLGRAGAGRLGGAGGGEGGSVGRGGGCGRWLARRHIAFRIGTAAQRLSELTRSRGQALAQEALRPAGRVAAVLVDFALIVVVAV